MLVCLRHMDKNKKPYGPNEVYVVNSLQKFVALVMNEKIGCTFRQLCEEYGIAGQSQVRNVSQPSDGNSGAVNVRSAPSPYMCLNCGVEISQTVRRISVEKTGKALCMSCRNKALSNK